MIRKNRVIRDSLHGVSELDARFRSVLDTIEFQRLRWIRQNGLTFLVYPGAEHSRFSHALGVYTIATRVFQHLRQLTDEQESTFSPSDLSDELLRAFQLAALCHDIGHTAFSHVFEPSLLPDGLSSHEDCTLSILQDTSLELAEAANNWCDVEEVVQLLQRQHWVLGLCHLISGEYDVDRWDYLLRDSRATGVKYGSFDLAWMIHSLVLAESESRPYVVLDGGRGVVALRQFFSARKNMYRQVYWHPTVRAGEKMVKAMFERASQSVPEELTPLPLRDVVHHSKRPSMSQFLDTDDTVVLAAIRSWATSEDELIVYLAKNFLRRRLFKSVRLASPIAQGEEPIDGKLLNDVKSIVLKEVARTSEFKKPLPDDAADYLVIQDNCSFRGHAIDGIFFVTDGSVKSLSELYTQPDFAMGDLLDPFTLTRLYVPDAARIAVTERLNR